MSLKAKTKREVHPVADLFPMLNAEELGELAASISAEGLLHPIVLDAKGRVLDGRNRLAACELANIQPTFETYEGDGDSYALAVNIARRQLSKGQLAMIAAKALLLNGNGSDTQSEVAAAVGVSQQRISQAVVVAQWAPALVDAVIAGKQSLNDACDKASEKKTAKESEEAELIAEARALSELATANPSLAGLVEAETITLEDAQKCAQLPTDLIDRVTAEHLTVSEAELIVQERDTRAQAYAEKVREAIRTLGRMAGNPVPPELAKQLEERELAVVTLIVDALGEDDYGFLG